jgi:hypothetical protein
VQIKAGCNQLLDAAAAFGAQLPGAALEVISDATDFRDEGPKWAPSPIIAAESKLTIEVVPGIRTHDLCADFD